MSDGDILKDIRSDIRDIRQEIRSTNTRIDGLADHLGARIDDTNVRLDGLTKRVVESEIRTATAITDLAHNVHELTSYLRTQGDLRPRVERCERDIADIQTKLRPAS